MVPDDEAEALATRDVVRAVPPRARDAHARAHAMVVGMLVAPVVRRADHPTEHQTTPLEVPPEADVESNVAVVGIRPGDCPRRPGLATKACVESKPVAGSPRSPSDENSSRASGSSTSRCNADQRLAGVVDMACELTAASMA